MSDTSETAARRLRHDSPTVDAVCRQLEHQADPSEVALVVEFAEIFFSKAPPEFLHERSTDALAHLALGAFRFLQRGRPDRVDVEVRNPEVGDEGWYAPVTVIRTNISLMVGLYCNDTNDTLIPDCLFNCLNGLFLCNKKREYGIWIQYRIFNRDYRQCIRYLRTSFHRIVLRISENFFFYL